MDSRNKTEIEILGGKYFLSERVAQDTLDLIEFTEKKLHSGQLTGRAQTFISATCISQALENNWKGLKWFSLKRWKLRRLFKAKKLMKIFSIRELNSLSETVLEMEGVDVKKKVREVEKDLTEESLLI